MEILLVFELSLADEALRESAKRAGIADLSPYAREYRCKIERSFLPPISEDYWFRFGDAYFTTRLIQDTDGEIMIFVDCRDFEGGFSSLVKALETYWTD